MGKKDRCALFVCNNDRRFPEKYMVKDHTSSFGGTFLLLQVPKALPTGRDLRRTKILKFAKIIWNLEDQYTVTLSHALSEGLWSGTRKKEVPMERLTVQPFRSKKKSDIASKQGGKKVAINIVDTPKKVFHCIFLGKKAIIITSKHGTTIFFPLQSYSTKTLPEKRAQKLSEYIGSQSCRPSIS